MLNHFICWCVVLALGAVTVACGRVGYGDEHSAVDASSDSDASDTSTSSKDSGGSEGMDADAGDASESGPCVLWSNFGTPTLVGGVQSVGDDWHGDISIDELTFVFFRWTDAVAQQDLYLATRSSISDAFSAPQAISELNSATAADLEPSLSGDELTLYFISNRTGGTGSFDIWRATRIDTSSPFGAAEEVSELNSAVQERAVYISKDELRVYFTSLRAGGLGSSDIFFSERPDKASAFSTPVLLDTLNSTSGEYGMSLSSDELVIFFASSRPGVGGNDVYTASRTSIAGSFQSPTLVNELSSANDEHYPTISASGTSMYFNYNEGPDSDMSGAHRVCLD